MMTHLFAGNPDEITKLGAEVVQSGLGGGFHFKLGGGVTRTSGCRQILEDSMNPQNDHSALR